MFHGRLQILPCMPTEPKAITQWINDQAAQGLMFKMAFPGRIVLFKKCEKKDTKYVLRTSTPNISNMEYVWTLGSYLVYKTTDAAVASEVKIAKAYCFRAILWVVWFFVLFNLPDPVEFPMEHRLSWLSVGIVFITLYFLIDIITHILFVFSRSGKYCTGKKVLNGGMLCVLAIGIAFILVNALYMPTGYDTHPILRENSKRAYVEEKYVPFGRCTQYTEHLAQGSSIRIADYRFVSSDFADYFFDLYCEDVDAKEITETKSTVCNELVRLFNYAEKDDTVQIVSNGACNFFLIKYGSRVIRFKMSSGVHAYDIFQWIEK